MTRALMPILTIALVALAGCARVAPESVALASRVDVAIERLGEQSETLIHAIGALHHERLDRSWGTIYERAESGFRTHHQLTPDTHLDASQRATIAAIAAESHDAIASRIRQTTDALIEMSRHNTSQALLINASVRTHLESLNTLANTQDQVVAHLEAMVNISLRQHLDELAQLLTQSANHQENTQ
ncbi:MAG: hypothetical protein ACF8GE_10685 [Phycisphaerales bacterium JB043]